MMNFSKVAIATVGALALTACNDNDNDSTASVNAAVPVEYQVTLSNLTNGQPISPPALLLHNDGEIFSVGTTASEALELLAEAGDSSEIVVSDFVLSYAMADAGIPYGESTTVTITYTDEVNYLSFASMLGNTNDAFTGLNKIDISGLAINDSATYKTVAYDSGTEANTETADTVPGPASDGDAEGFNSDRDDINMVTMHPGIVSADDGLSTSTLSYQHKFDNPVMSVTITRIQ